MNERIRQILKNNMNEPKLRKGQKCWFCKKEIKDIFCYNGHWWHSKCKDKDSAIRIIKYLKSQELKK